MQEGEKSMYYPKEIFSINESITKRNMHEYDKSRFKKVEKTNFYTDDEKITIEGCLTDGYYIYYGVGDRRSNPYDYSSVAGKFRDFFDAFRTMKNHRKNIHATCCIEW